MKKTLLTTLLFTLYGFITQAQVLNQSANWPNENWSLSGSYDAAFVYEDPTVLNGSSSFSFNDDEAGGTSDNNVAAESPTIDLSTAFNANETEIIVVFQYVYNIYQTETFRLQYWDADNNQWLNWGEAIEDSTAAGSDFCTRPRTDFTSDPLSIAQFSGNQLQNFKYRLDYNDNTSYGWGFCMDAPTLISNAPPACPSILNLTVSNVSDNSAQANWDIGDSETSWEVAIILASANPPSSGTITNNTAYTFSNLTQETNYLIYVRAVCGADGFSLWESISLTTGTDLSGYPVTFTANPLSTTGSYDIALVDLNGDFLDDAVSVSDTNINVHYQLATGGFNSVNITTTQADNLPTWSLAAGDFDNNGYNDLVYGSTSGVTFMKANETGTGYTEISGTEDIFSQRTNFVDINNDGNLDAFVCHDVQANVYYINDGTGNLTYYQGRSEGVVPNGLGLIPGGGNYGTVWIDYDNDRDMDMFIAKCRGGSTPINTNELWRNDGNGIFVNVADTGWYNDNYPIDGHNNTSNLGDIVQTWSSAWADFDNDGDMDVYVGASSSSPTNGTSKLMRNNGDGTFTDVTAGSGVLDAQLGVENAPADFDNDGYVDIISNGDVLFNNGDFTFTNYASNMPPSGAIGDANNDGFLDIFRSGTIYLNNTNSNNWLKINTIGTDSNINGIGARVEILTPSGIQIREVRSGEGFEFMSSLNTHFGIGADTTINNITIYWPSGVVDYIPNPAINSTINIIEGTALNVEDETLGDVSIYPNPVKEELTIKTSANVINKIATVFDINGKRILSMKLKSNKIDVSKLTSGVYFLRLESEGKTMKRKFIKQ
ncbi:FG-GAP-like repeat-containing protein [Winogradskyella bathintestinalis]|uniref:FG-GAP-like repeat-containing protein n=1 Tax=Winogradskyella bathintestinalis TaxID=3035208 RepID=A0ABT7ZR64_9FLAO|nr:FG-GAP-like repeat-containing protein [Winogradskyella bathintestinalis]MDN3491482.1 FG-GAP-like repeat-containing protein [Winogradskyella bathintestinalis]